MYVHMAYSGLNHWPEVQTSMLLSPMETFQSSFIHSFIPDLLIAWHLTDRASLLETPLPSSFHSTAFSHSTLPATSCVSFKGF